MKLLGRLLVLMIFVGMSGQTSFAKEEVDPALTLPRKAHKIFKSMVGKWSFSTHSWRSPGSEPERVGSGLSTNTTLYGGRFLKLEIVGGDKDGQAVESTRIMGYDNLREEYQTFMLGSKGTSILFMAGTFDAASKIIKTEGTVSLQVTGEAARRARTEIHLIGDDSYSITFYLEDPKVGEFKAVETFFTRMEQVLE